ncbi:hypothetical protein [Desulforamulus ferrireducens]|nr:hypothetical protein [Desulforamulus ferrireducens]
MLKKKLTTLTIKPAMLELTRQQQRQVGVYKILCSAAGQGR